MTMKIKLEELYAKFKNGDSSDEEETTVPQGFHQKISSYSFEVGIGNRKESTDRIAAVILYDGRLDDNGNNIRNYAFFFRGDNLDFPLPILNSDGGVVFFGYEGQLPYFLATLTSGMPVTLSCGLENMYISVERRPVL